jgi:branched-chain amino acid aminotransferase
MADRVAFWNGRIVPESELRLSFQEALAFAEDGVYDAVRTFGGKPFMLREHLERLEQSLAYVRLDPGFSLDELGQASLELCRRNWDGTDFWISLWIGRGVGGGATVVIECSPIPFAERAHFYRDGVVVRTSSVRRTPPWAQSPRAKAISALNLSVAAAEVRDADPDALPLLLDEHGNLCEAWGSNVFVVSRGRLATPQERFVLPGVTRGVVIGLARELGLVVEERDIDVFEAATADEVFLTSTSLCVCPVESVDGYKPRAQRVPGPVTERLQRAFAEHLDFDFVGQYLSHAA